MRENHKLALNHRTLIAATRVLKYLERKYLQKTNKSWSKSSSDCLNSILSDWFVLRKYSTKVKYLIQELFEIEYNYVQCLKAGIQNYIVPFEAVALPDTLDIPKFHVFSNIEAILEFHEMRLLPALRECSWNLEKIANVFTRFIEENQFNNYIIYVLMRKTSEKLCRENKYFFMQLSRDKLGINGFLLLPIQQLPRYKLLFIELVKELLKDITNHKNALVCCCNAEKALEKLIKDVDESCGWIADCQNNLKCNKFLHWTGDYPSLDIATVIVRLHCEIAF